MIVDAALAADGALNAKVKYSMRGDNELLLRIAFHQSPRDKWKEVAQLLALSDGFRGKIISASASDPTVTKLPFTVEYEISQTKFVDWAKKPVRIPALLPQLAVPDLPEKAADGAAASPIDLGTPLDVDTRVTLRFPPAPALKSRQARSSIASTPRLSPVTTRKAVVITASRHINFLHRQVPAGQSADYAAFLHAVQTDQSQHFTLSRTDAAAHPSTPKAATPKPQLGQLLNLRGMAKKPAQRPRPTEAATRCATAEQAAEKCDKTRKELPSGAEAIEGTQFTSALKHRPPEEVDFSRSL